MLVVVSKVTAGREYPQRDRETDNNNEQRTIIIE
jgi:hypothetical protein